MRNAKVPTLSIARITRPDRPDESAFIEKLDSRLRAECLNENRFLSLEDAGEKAEEWRKY